MSLCQAIDRARKMREDISTEPPGRTQPGAYRQNSHGQQIQVMSVVLWLDPAAYCPDGYIIIVNWGGD